MCSLYFLLLYFFAMQQSDQPLRAAKALKAPRINFSKFVQTHKKSMTQEIFWHCFFVVGCFVFRSHIRQFDNLFSVFYKEKCHSIIAEITVSVLVIGPLVLFLFIFLCIHL